MWPSPLCCSLAQGRVRMSVSVRETIHHPMDNAIHTIPGCNADRLAHGTCNKINSNLGHRPGMAARSKLRGVFRSSASHSGKAQIHSVTDFGFSSLFQSQFISHDRLTGSALRQSPIRKRIRCVFFHRFFATRFTGSKAITFSPATARWAWDFGDYRQSKLWAKK